MTDTPGKPHWSDLFGSMPNSPGPAPDVTTDDVCDRYMSDIQANEWGPGSYSMDDYGAAFTRWLAAHDAEVKATALREAATAVMAESNDLRDSATCHSVANDLRTRAAELGQP